MIPSYNQVVVDRKALLANYRLLHRKGIPAQFLAMVKADGYGHGMVECSQFLHGQGCTIFGVAELGEAVTLRQSGITSQIFCLIEFLPEYADTIIEYDITPIVFNSRAIEALSRVAEKRLKKVGVHLKVDCGMSRLGVTLHEVSTIVNQINKLPGIFLEGIASHFPCSDDTLSDDTEKTNAIFEVSIEQAGKSASLIRHIANSGATLYFPATHRDMVRCGISLYGYYPDGEHEEKEAGLQPVMAFKSRVIQVKKLPVGTGIGYGHTFTTKKITRLAVIPVGYEDGYSRLLSNSGEVLIRGERAPIRGRVCMNLCMVDVTEIENVETGDEVVLLGKQGDEHISANQIAMHSDTISYEVLCMIGNNNQRLYI